MTPPRIVVTTNGPGELMGWTRPFLRAVFDRAPDADVTIVFVPCPYATGAEAQRARALFPNASVIDPKAYSRFLLRKSAAGMHRSPGALQYLGGDLFHATTVARRLGLRPMTYKFTRRSYAQSFARFFALDEANASSLRRNGAPADRVRIVGNLVPDAVLGSLTRPVAQPGSGDGIVIMPGSRPNEIKHALPFFLAVAVALHRTRPDLRITFVLSDFNSDVELRASLGAPPDPIMFGAGGRLADDGNSIESGGVRFALDRSGNYSELAQAALVVTIPGTKCIEAAVLGRPMLVTVPLNRPDVIAISGIAGYLHLVPFVGRPLKSWIVRATERRYRFVTQPNIDANCAIVPEMRGVLRPETVAYEVAALIDRPQDLRSMGVALSQIYASHVGASGRMADEALSVARDAIGEPAAASL